MKLFFRPSIWILLGVIALGAVARLAADWFERSRVAAQGGDSLVPSDPFKERAKGPSFEDAVRRLSIERGADPTDAIDFAP